MVASGLRWTLEPVFVPRSYQESATIPCWESPAPVASVASAEGKGASQVAAIREMCSF